MSQLVKVVTSLKPCSGVNKITKRVLVDALEVIGDKLLNIINVFLSQGVYSEEWKESKVIPTVKVRNPIRAEDRRLINIRRSISFCSNGNRHSRKGR